MKKLSILLAGLFIYGALGATFNHISMEQLNSTTLKDFYWEIEKLQQLSPSRKKFELFLRAVEVDKTYGLGEERLMAQMTAWPFNWLVSEDMVEVEKAPRTDNNDIILTGLLHDSHFFVGKDFLNQVSEFSERLEIKLGRNDNLRLYACQFTHGKLDVKGWALYNKSSQEALLVLVIED